MQNSVPGSKTATSDSRKTKRFHPCLPEGFEIHTVADKPKPPPLAPAPELTKEQADRNLLLQAQIRGEDVVTQVPGCLGSIYVPGTKCCVTIASGTGHSWPCLGAQIFFRATTPWSPEYPWGWFEEHVPMEDRLACLIALCGPLFNASRNQIWDAEGHWSTPEATRRASDKAYGMDPEKKHHAFGWCLYPAWPQEALNPKAIRVWDLKFMVEAQMQWDLRFGRVLRQILTNHKRKIREDFAKVIFPNYYYSCQRRNEVTGAPCLPLWVYVYTAYSRNVILGELGGKAEAGEPSKDPPVEFIMYTGLDQMQAQDPEYDNDSEDEAWEEERKPRKPRKPTPATKKRGRAPKKDEDKAKDESGGAGGGGGGGSGSGSGSGIAKRKHKKKRDSSPLATAPVAMPPSRPFPG
jgi:hypothetical protein